MIATIVDILKVLGALAFFFYGMKIMSEGIQKAGSVQLRKVLFMMTRNRFLGIFSFANRGALSAVIESQV